MTVSTNKKVIRKYEGVLYSNAKNNLKLVKTKDVVHGKEITKEFIRENDSVTIIALLNEREVIMINNYRAAGLRSRSFKDAFSYELPSGHIEKGETIKEAAHRELEEETGFKAKKMKLLTSRYVGLYITTLKDYVFVARNLIKGKTKLEKDEDIVFDIIRVDDIPKLLKNNTIKDSSSRDALFYWLMFDKFGPTMGY